MKDFSLSVLLAIVRDTIGIDPWIVIGLVALAVVAFLVSLARHGLRGPQFRAAVITGIIGGLVAMGAAPTLTAASFENLGGALDWLSLLLIGVASGGGIGMLVFAVVGLATPAGKHL